LANRVRFQGHVSRDVIGEFYTNCSVAVVSSVWPEPFGAVGLEAMQYGVPVVAFDAGGIKEWLIDGHNGYLVPWRDCAVFAARVEELLRDKELARRLGQNGRKLVTDGYSFSNYIGGLEDLFQRVSRPTSPAMATTC
jgi:glycosyltransferase involved in cell wall biosynthesis